MSLGGNLPLVFLQGGAMVALPLVLRPEMVVLYVFYVLCGVAILYSLMIALSATSIWLGQNRSLYDFWFYITNFARYPMEIYHGPIGGWLRWSLTFLLPVLVVVNVPAGPATRTLTLASPVVSSGSIRPLAFRSMNTRPLMVAEWKNPKSTALTAINPFSPTVTGLQRTAPFTSIPVSVPSVLTSGTGVPAPSSGPPQRGQERSSISRRR